MKRIAFFYILLLFVPSVAFAEGEPDEKKPGLIRRLIDKFTAPCDTVYITPNKYRFAVMLQNTNTFQQYLLRAKNADGAIQSISISPVPTLKLGPYFGWNCFYFGYTFDVIKLGKGAVTKRTDINFSMYRRRFGFDLIYQKNSGDFRLLRTRGFGDDVGVNRFRRTHFDGMDAHTVTFNTYYVFNYRRFSYPAAYAKDTQQKKSQGSWIIGVRYDHQTVNFDYTRLPVELIGTSGNVLFEELRFKRFSYDNISITGGYAYNWVFASNWLFAISLSPAVGVKFTKGEKVDDIMHKENFNFNAIGRAALLWNNTRFFAGASLVSNVYGYNNTSRLSFTNALHYFNVYFGVNFCKKKR